MTGKLAVAVVVAALTAAGCSGKTRPQAEATHPQTVTVTVTRNAPSVAAKPKPSAWVSAPQVEYGRIVSLTPLGEGYKLRFDLQLIFGPDKTGIRACIDNHECPPSQDNFTDDTYIHDLKYVLTYYLPPTASVELVGFYPKPDPVVTARYFYSFTRGHNPRHIQAMATGASALSDFAFDIQVGNIHGPSKNYFKGFQSVTKMFQVYHP